MGLKSHTSHRQRDTELGLEHGAHTICLSHPTDFIKQCQPKKYTNYHLHGFTSEAYKEAPDHQCFLEQQNSCFAKEIK